MNPRSSSCKLSDEDSVSDVARYWCYTRQGSASPLEGLQAPVVVSISCCTRHPCTSGYRAGIFFGEGGLLSGGLSGRDRAILGLDRHVAYLDLFGSLDRHAARFDLFGDFDRGIGLYRHSRATTNKGSSREDYEQDRELPHAVLLSKVLQLASHLYGRPRSKLPPLGQRGARCFEAYAPSKGSLGAAKRRPAIRNPGKTTLSTLVPLFVSHPRTRRSEPLLPPSRDACRGVRRFHGAN
jgi:hypothetical protein